MAHPLPTDLINSNGDGLFSGAARWAFNVTGGLFWILMLLGFCMVLYISSARFGGTRAFSFASIVGLLGATMLATARLMDWWIASAFILVGVIGLGMQVLGDN